jgi:hypothetical protein
MITINYKEIDGVNVPERNLTENEKKTVVGMISNGSVYIYYQHEDMDAYFEFLNSIEQEENNN